MEEESSGSTGGIATLASVAFVVLSCMAMAVLAVMNHPHKAVLLLVVTMFVMAAMRAVWPGRPWFASRRHADGRCARRDGGAAPVDAGAPVVCLSPSMGRCWALCRSWSAYLVLLSLHRNPRPRLM